MVHMIQDPQFMLKLFFATSGCGCTIYTNISCHIALAMILQSSHGFFRVQFRLEILPKSKYYPNLTKTVF